MKRRTLALLIAIGLLTMLFTVRFVYELSVPERSSDRPQFVMNQQMSNVDSSSSLYPKNYVSEKIVIEQPKASAQVVDQKYERVANIVSRSVAFDPDVRAIMDIVTRAKSVIQSENAYGLPGARTLALSLGVVPDAFDPTVAALKNVGKLGSIVVTKTDRTADFKALEAKRLSLEKTRDGLRALRTGGAALADLVALETKILEIEGQVQELGVSLGDFSADNSFCTINVTISEAAPSLSASRLVRASVDALSWALLVMVGLAIVTLAAAGTAALTGYAVTRFKELSAKKASQ